MRIAVSGHRGLPAETERLVEQALHAELRRHADDLVGISCLADGADQLFARTVVDLGGQLEVVVPARKYRQALPEDSHTSYDELMAHATKVHELDFDESTSESHMAASERMVNDADLLLAVWDGLPARAYGGTADVVAHARKAGVPVVVIWPDGSTRD